MDHVLPAKSLPGTLSLSNRGIRQSHYGIIYRSGSGTVHDVSSRKFHPKSNSAAH